MSTQTLATAKRKLKFLLSAKDGGPADMWKALEQPLLDRGHSFVFDLEGVAQSKFPERYPLLKWPTPGQQITEAEAEGILIRHNVDALLLTSDSPMNRNLPYARAARKLGKQTIVPVDVDGVLARFESHAVSLALERSNASYQADLEAGCFEKAVICGHPMSEKAALLLAKPPPDLGLEVSRVTDCGRLKLVMVAGQRPETTVEMLRLLLASARKTAEKMVVYIRLHPDPTKCVRTDALLAAMGRFVEAGIPTVDLGNLGGVKYSAEQIGSLVDGCLTAYSTLADWMVCMNTAVFVVSTDPVRADLASELRASKSSLKTWHLWPGGYNEAAATNIPEGGIDLSTYLRKPNPHAEAFRQSLQWKPEKAIRAIEEVCG